MRTVVVAAVLALLVSAAPAGAATKLRVSAPSSATVGSSVRVKLSDPRTGKVRIYLLAHSKRRAADRPTRRGNLKRGKVTLTLKLSSVVRTYRLIACLERRTLVARGSAGVASAAEVAAQRGLGGSDGAASAAEVAAQRGLGGSAGAASAAEVAAQRRLGGSAAAAS